MTGGEPWQATLAEATCPVLLVRADHESGAILTPEMAAEAMATCPSVVVAQISGAGHNIRRDAFGPYMTAVTEFMARVTG